MNHLINNNFRILDSETSLCTNELKGIAEKQEQSDLEEIRSDARTPISSSKPADNSPEPEAHRTRLENKTPILGTTKQ